ncbi:MAG: SulP family inorganic anion transporter [Pseudomonadota bacterium]
MQWNRVALSNEGLGGLAATIVSIPAAMGYGIIAFSPLGPEYAAQGISAGFLSAILGGLLSSLLGGAPGMLSGPKAPLAILFATVIAHYLALIPGAAGAAVAMALITVLLAGVLQVLFGLFRIGNLVTWIPFPVIAGFLNGTAVLIVIGQLRPLLGLPPGGALLDAVGRAQPLTIVVALVTIVVTWHAGRWIRRVHASFIGLLAGTASYYGLAALFGRDGLGPCIGAIAVRAPNALGLADIGAAWQLLGSTGSLSFLLMAALSLALLSALDSLMSAATYDSLSHTRTDVNRELAGQGLANIAAALAGGIASAGGVAASAISYQAGGRGRLSGVVKSVALLAVFVLLSGLVERIPEAVLAGILLVIALRLFDPWSIRLYASLLSSASFTRPDRWQGALITTLVMLVAVCSNLILAVGTGVAAAIVLLLGSMSKSTVRRRLSGQHSRSNHIRNDARTACLNRHGARIQILELEGALFFGSTGHLSKTIDACAADACHYLILDLRRVRNMDISCARVLAQMRVQLAGDGTALLLSHVHAASPAWDTLAEAGFFHGAAASHFNDTDSALQYAEDALLDSLLGSVDDECAVPLADFGLMQGLTEQQLALFSQSLRQLDFARGDIVVRQGEHERAMYFLLRGTVDVTLNQAHGQPAFRLRTMASGTVFGEISMLQAEPRSANVVAATALQCYSLSLAEAARLQAEHPEISVIVMSNLARLLAERLRYALNTIAELQ